MIFVMSRQLFLQVPSELTHCFLRPNGLGYEQCRHLSINCLPMIRLSSVTAVRRTNASRVKPGVHTNDFAPIYGRREAKLGHASLATVFRPSRLTFQSILRDNLEAPVVRSQRITTAVVHDPCLNTKWHHGAPKEDRR